MFLFLLGFSFLTFAFGFFILELKTSLIDDIYAKFSSVVRMFLNFFAIFFLLSELVSCFCDTGKQLCYSLDVYAYDFIMHAHPVEVL